MMKTMINSQQSEQQGERPPCSISHQEALGDTVRAYLDAIGTTTLLTACEEQDLAIRVSQGD